MRLDSGRLVEAEVTRAGAPSLDRLGTLGLSNGLAGARLEPGVASGAPTWVGAEGQVFDAPTGATAIVERIAAQPWTGLFVAFDYGLSFAALSAERPAGTARAYHRHRQSNDLLAKPGQQDLTCHICWDWIAAALANAGFEAPTLEAQEAFLVHHAEAAIAARVAADAGKPTMEKRALMQLIHPAHLGQKFQVMHAARWQR